MEFTAVISSHLYFGVHFGFKTFSRISFFFPESGWHIQKVSLIQRFKMCLQRRVSKWHCIPLAACLLPPSPLLIYLSEKESKRQPMEGGGCAWKTPRNKQLTSCHPPKQRGPREDDDFHVQRLFLAQSWKLVYSVPSSVLKSQLTRQTHCSGTVFTADAWRRGCVHL